MPTLQRGAIWHTSASFLTIPPGSRKIYLMNMTAQQKIAISHPCYLPEDTTAIHFYRELRSGFKIGLTVNSGFE